MCNKFDSTRHSESKKEYELKKGNKMKKIIVGVMNFNFNACHVRMTIVRTL